MAIHDEEAEKLSKRLEMKSSWVRPRRSVLREELESLLAYGRRLVHYTQQARKSDETQEAEKSQSNVPDDDWPMYIDFFMTPSHPAKSENYGMPDEAEKSQSNVPDDDSNLTLLHPLKYRKRGAPDKAEERRRASFNFLSCLLRRIMWTPSPWEEQPKVRAYRESCHVFSGVLCRIMGTPSPWEEQPKVRAYREGCHGFSGVLRCIMGTPSPREEQPKVRAYREICHGFSGLLRRIMGTPSPWEEQPKVRAYREICHGFSGLPRRIMGTPSPQEEQPKVHAYREGCHGFSGLLRRIMGTPSPREEQPKVRAYREGCHGFSGLPRRIMGMPSPREEQPKVHAYSESCHGYGIAALVLSLLTFTAGMCPVSGTMCDGQAMAVSKGEVAIVCPLTADVRQTKQSVLIKYFKPSDYPDDVLECDWKSSEVRFHCLHTQFRAELIAIHPDRVLARLPKDRLGNGTYHCQLVPPDPEPFTDCDICDPDDAKDVPTTEAAPETLPTTLDHFEGMKEKPQISVHGAAGGQHGGLVAAVVILSIIVFCLLLAMAAMVVFFLRYSGMIPGRNKTDERRPEEANGFIA